MKRIFSVVVCAVGVFFSSREQRRMLKKLRIGGQFAPVRILRNVCYDSAFELSTDISGAESCCAGLVSLSGQGDRTSCSCAEEAD